ncbi:uncharacterized protein LOC123533853 isoform X3 [Mercenaria mercenaria]|uniref:uncharacterized protein LOC123533853 isoform X3 n=1 Tax=Mercenaria mercenaria TaxID=6596 RepID=UPI00234E7F6A|nr:uncharacterized protein LOC123533853 isoform X3 [Mercenaria mercenaria]
MYRSRGKALNNDINLDNAFRVNRFSDNKFSDTNILRWIGELKDIPTAREFLLWMRGKYSRSVPKDNLSFDDFDAMQQNYQCSDTHSQRNQDSSRTNSTGSHFLLSDNMSNYQNQNTVFNNAYTNQKGDNASRSAIASNYFNLKRNEGQKFRQMSADSQTEAQLSRENKKMQKRFRRNTKDSKTKFIKGNGKRKRVQDSEEVIDLTVEDTVEMPYNLSKNPVEVHDSISSNVQENLICFAPYEEYETDFDYVDENSILAIHHRNYRIVLEAKRVKTSHVAAKGSEFVKNKQDLYGQLQGNNSKFTAEKRSLNDCKHVGKTKTKSDDAEGEEEIDFQFRIDPEWYLDDEFEQYEAIDYSIRSKSESGPETDNSGKQVYSNLNSERLSGYSSERVPPNIEERRADNFLNGLDAPVTLNKSSKGSFNTQKGLVTYSSCNKTNCSERVTHKNSGKKCTCSVKNNTGLVNSVDKLGHFFPVAQSKTVSLGEKKTEKVNCFGTNELNKKARSTELFRLLTTSIQYNTIERNNVRKTDDMEKDNTCTRREKKTLEDVIDTMITDIMDSEERTYPGAIISVKEEGRGSVLSQLQSPTTVQSLPTSQSASMTLPLSISDFPTSVLIAAASHAFSPSNISVKEVFNTVSKQVTSASSTASVVMSPVKQDITSTPPPSVYSPGNSSPPSANSPSQSLTAFDDSLMSLRSPEASSFNDDAGSKIHLSAERKRRNNIKTSGQVQKSGFDLLHSLIPSLRQNPNAKVSKAAMLQKTAEYCKKLKSERVQMQNEADILKQEISSLNQAIGVCQSQLPATGVPVTRQRADQMREMFEEYVKQRTLTNWKFWIFSLIIRNLFESYNTMVSTASVDELCRTVLAWLDQHCSLPSLRPIVSDAMRHLSTTTSILSDPARVPEQAAQAVIKRQKHQSGDGGT